jgi:hypothetical protein
MRARSLGILLSLPFALLACGSSGGSNGNHANGGTSNGGTSNGGTSNGGTSNGGTSNGGTSSGGTSNGGTSNGGTSSGGSAGTSSGGAGGTSSGPTLASQYPGDVGIDKDPDVIWTENFEEGSASAMLARYDDKNPTGLTLDSDVPPKSSGKASGKLTASGAGPNAVDFYKNLQPGYDEWYVRYYVKYQGNAPWHHTSVWVGGYNPPLNYAFPHAGEKPNGDDRFSVAFEPQEENVATPRMDFYNYWMQMHSWMDQPSGNTAYYGNSLIHDPSVVATGQWQCVEIHIKLNTDVSSGTGAELGLWVDDQSIIQFTDSSPLGYWVKDKFCPEAATGTECTDYKPANPTLVPLDLQFRTTTDLKLNYFWPQNYITDTGSGTVWYDDMVIAKRRIGCIQ